MDQHGVALADPGHGQQVPGGAAGQQQARGLLEAQRRGLVSDVGRVGDDLLGVTAAEIGGDHLVADVSGPV